MYIPPPYPQKRICGCAYIHIRCHYFSSIPLMFIRSCEVPRHQNRSVIVTLYILTNHRTAPLLEIRWRANLRQFFDIANSYTEFCVSKLHVISVVCSVGLFLCCCKVTVYLSNFVYPLHPFDFFANCAFECKIWKLFVAWFILYDCSLEGIIFIIFAENPIAEICLNSWNAQMDTPLSTPRR